METRSGRLVKVESAIAMQAHQSVVPVLGGALLVRGSYEAPDLILAKTILREKDAPALWEDDQ